MMKYSESDWKLFRKKLPNWQEEFIEKLNNEYIEILTSDDLASNKFWEIEKRINEDKKNTGVIARMSRSNMFQNIINLYFEEAITLEDLEEFSEELQKDVKDWIEFIDRNYEDVEEEF